MTTFRAIGDSEVAVDAPITQQLVQALRDNILSVQEGDSSAPVIALPEATAGNNIVAMDVVNYTYDAARREFISEPIFVRRAGTYRVFIIGKLSSSRTGNSFFDLNKLTEGNFLNKDSNDTATDDSIQPDSAASDGSADNQVGGTKILDGIEADASGEKEVGISADVTLAKNDAIFMTCSFDASGSSDTTNQFAFGFAIANEPLTYSGAGLQLNTSTVKWINEYDRFFSDSIGSVSDSRSRQKAIIRS